MPSSARDDLAQRIARRVAEREGQCRVTQHCGDGSVETWLSVGTGSLRVQGTDLAVDSVRAVGVAGTQIALFLAPSSTHDVLLQVDTEAQAERLAKTIPRLKKYFHLSEGELSTEDVRLGTAPDPSSPASSLSSGVHLVPKRLQRPPPTSLDAQYTWCPFHPSHPITSSVPAARREEDSPKVLPSVGTPGSGVSPVRQVSVGGGGGGGGAVSPGTEMVCLGGKITLSNTSHGTLQVASAAMVQNLREAAVRDISHSLGVPQEWVTVSFSSRIS